MDIEIKKLAAISAITVSKQKEKDIIDGVINILDYVTILTNIHSQSHKIYDTRQTNIFRNPEISIAKSSAEEKITIIKQNAPILNENYFNVPALITRKS